MTATTEAAPGTRAAGRKRRFLARKFLLSFGKPMRSAKAMTDTVFEAGGQRVLAFDAEGAPLSTAGDVSDFISAAWEHKADVVVLPVGRIDPSFFSLRSGLAGEAIQKFVNYRIRLVVLGDIAEQMAASDALRDFVYESNRGRHVWFLRDLDAVKARLAAEG